MLARFYLHWRGSYSGIPLTIWFLALVNLVNRIGGMVVGFISVYLTDHLGFSIREAGYVMTCFGFGAIAGAYAGGRLTDRHGYYPVQLWSLALNGVMLLALLLVRDLWPMCAAVLILSFFAELFRPANSVAIALHSDPENRTRSISLMRMAYNLGWTVAPALGGIIAKLYGWHWLFWADGLTCILAAVMLKILIAPRSEGPKTRAHEHADSGQKAFRPAADRIYLLFLLFTFLGAIVFMQIMWTAPVFFRQAYQWSEDTIGLVVALNGLIVFLVEMPLIFQMEGKRDRLTFVRYGLVLYAFSYLCLLAPVSFALPAAVMYITLISFGEIFVMPFSSNYAYGTALKRGNQGQYMAFYTMAYSIANIVAPFFGTQIIAHWGYRTLWCAVAVLAFLTWIGFRYLQRYTLQGAA